MSRICLGSLLVIFGTLFLLNSAEIISSFIYLKYLNLFQKYWPGLLIILGLKMIIADKKPGLAEVLKWLVVLLIGLWIFAAVFVERNWII
jgi:hypothetical protein